jgi:integrase
LNIGARRCWGGDPLAEKRAERATLTFAQAVEIYAAVKLKEFSSEKHRKQWVSSLERLAMPTLGHMAVRNIEVADVLRMLEPHWRERTVPAKKLRGRVEAVLSWCTVSGHRTGDNPARWVGNLKELLPAPGKVAPVQNQPSLALGDELRWWSALETRDGMAAKALRFLTLTAARSGEVRGMTWDEIDLGADDVSGGRILATIATSATWTIPASRMKADLEHRVPLTPEAVALLRSLPRMDGRPYVFFAQRGGMLSDM